MCVCVCVHVFKTSIMVLWKKNTRKDSRCRNVLSIYICVMYDSVLSYKLIFLKLIISLRGEDWVHTTSVTPPPFFY